MRFNSAGTHIEEVEMYEHTGTELTNRTTKSRSSVVTSIDSGYTFCTATKNSDGTYAYGAEVKVVTIDYEKLIKKKPRHQEGQPRQSPDLLIGWGMERCGSF